MGFLGEWVVRQHLARFVVEVIDGLELSELVKIYRGSGPLHAAGEPC
jgi:hypothetical protein